jgi:hypothetical protein
MESYHARDDRREEGDEEREADDAELPEGLEI